jgi:acyl carrier protein
MTTAFTPARVEAIREILLEHLEVDPDELTDHSRFIEDHEADSLRLMDVIAALEKKFDIEIDEAQIVRLVDLHSACELVSELADR